MPDLSNIRDYLGWIIGRRVVDVTAGDPVGVPDSHGDGDENFVVLHFDNGGTLDVPITEKGFSYDNPVSAAADRGELCSDCMGGQRHAVDPPNVRADDPRWSYSGPLWARGDFDCAGPIDESRIADILYHPPAYAPQNPYYQKNYASAPGTVRQWFRAMRAADYYRECFPVATVKPAAQGDPTIWRVYAMDEPDGWTLFDTQKVVDRETAAHYLPPDLGPLYVLRLHNARLDAGCTLFGWPVVFDRSQFPILSSKVQPAKGAFTPEILGYVAAPPNPCPKCRGPRRWAPAPEHWCGPGGGQLLYHYASLLAPDNRYLTYAHGRLAMCDPCQLASLETT